MISSRAVSYAVFAWLTSLSLTVSAQVAEREPLPAPTTATVPYQSVFSDYKGFQDPKPVSWRQANDQVAEAAGNSDHDMSSMTAEAKGSEMPSIPGHDMSKMKKEESKAAAPAAGEANKDSKSMEGMPRMKGMDHSKMKDMQNNMKNEKDKQ